MMEEEEQLPKVCQCLEHAVWGVGVHLGTGMDMGEDMGEDGWDEVVSNCMEILHQLCEPLWTSPHPFHSLRCLFFYPQDEVRGVFRDVDGGRL